MTSSSVKFRSDIEGLRGIAVLFVVAFHAFPKKFTGGFIGVDIFFVISGFLISSIIFNEISNNSFNFKNFYCRRLKRLLPALISFLFLAIVLGWFVMLDYEYSYIGEHIFISNFFLNNIKLLQEINYFDRKSFLKPLLNLWSLSVEFQFYIIWPFLIYVCSSSKKQILILILFMIIYSFSYNLYIDGIDSQQRFYLLKSRLWELACGALVAWFYFYNPNKKDIKKNLADFLSIFALTILVCYLFLFTNYSPNQGLMISGVILASMILLICHNSIINNFIFSNQFLKYFGLVSYPLYLYHWLLFSYTRSLYGINLDYKISFLIILISLIISHLTYIYIEKPIRKLNLNNFKIIFLILPFFLTGLCGLYIVEQRGIKNRTINSIIDNSWIDTINSLVTPEIEEDCQKKLKTNLKDRKNINCVSNSENIKNFFIGDSHSLALSTSIFIKKKPYASAVFFNHGCITFKNYIFNYNMINLSDCKNYNNKIFEIIENNPSIESIIIAFRTNYCMSNFDISGDQSVCFNKNKSNIKFFDDEYSDLFTSLLKYNKKKIIFIIDNPEVPYFKISIIHKNLIKKFDIKYSNEYFQEYYELINRLKKKFPEIYFYDITNFFCNNNFCNIVDENLNIPLYYDYNHISTQISDYIIEDLYKKGLIAK